MWDAKVKPISLAMRADALDNLPEFALPEAYGWRYYRPGDERDWARIEMSAGEWTRIEQGLEAFRRSFSETEPLERRMIFLTDGGRPFATATAWFDDERPEVGRLHWVAVDAEHQGRGLSWPLVSLAMAEMRALGHRCAYLTTQTASWVAIRVYHRFGFRPMVRSAEEIEGWEIVSERTGIDFAREIAEQS